MSGKGKGANREVNQAGRERKEQTGDKRIVGVGGPNFGKRGEGKMEEGGGREEGGRRGRRLDEFEDREDGLQIELESVRVFVLFVEFLKQILEDKQQVGEHEGFW